VWVYDAVRTAQHNKKIAELDAKVVVAERVAAFVAGLVLK